METLRTPDERLVDLPVYPVRPAIVVTDMSDMAVDMIATGERGMRAGCRHPGIEP
jgi:hypothetical protein